MLKQPPHSTESEQSLLGGLLLDNHAFEQVSWLAPNALYEDRHRRIWACLTRMLEAGKAADVTTVADALGEDLDKVGGLAYLGALAQNTPSALNIKRYAELVHVRAVQRDIITAGNEIAEAGFAPGTPEVAHLIEQAEALVFGVAERAQGKTGGPVPIAECVTEYLDWIEAHPNGIETGLKDFDALTGGLLAGNLVIVAGRTHMGKTALALQFAEHICMDAPGVMFSMEASRREVAGRLFEWRKAKVGRDAAADNVYKLKIFVDESPAVSPGTVRARLRRMKRQHGVSVVIIDYLQLMRGRGDNREQEVASISRDLKAIAKEFEVPVIAVAQLNRKVEDRSDKRPHMSDLRESGALEQDADLIALLYRPDYYDPNFDGNLAEAEIHVPKNRNTGRTGLVKVMFSREIGRFGDWLPERYRGAA